ncbi:class I adenylate-forming enzyme family protein [Thalassotalea sp. Y01]|uniref:class I adenylate-forming enzyme family protein n=1 Tax=Thalassotalea sp. Y01 TaxID=2729613 RepID=UPI00145FB816|nr:class I adenylate-forming enzyme family protein [Thalassotalea sp. Y01]NMP15490.1 acyl--CoA ligase [Thalassotalea sp. Y01]
MSLKNQDITIDQVSADKVVDEIMKITAAGQPFAVTKKNRNNIDYTAFENLPNSLGDMYKTAANTFEHGEFIIYKDERISFANIYQQATAFGHALEKEFNVQKGDRIAIAMRNYPDWIVAFMGITLIGAVAVPLNAWWQCEEFTQVIEHSQAVLVITDDKRYSLLANWLDDKSLPFVIARPNQEQSDLHNIEQLCAQYAENGEITNGVKTTDIATIFYTSGSTGTPKGAVSSHESILTAVNTWLMLGNAAAIANADISTPSPYPAAALMTVPLFHVTGCHTLFLLSMIAGRKTVMMPYWDAEHALKLIEQERITYFNGVPTMSMELMDHPMRDHYDLSSLLDVCAGGAARPAEHVRKIYDSFSSGNPSCGYGLTETNALGAVNGPADYLLKPNSAGLPTPPIVEIQILDDNNQPIEIGDIGEIVIKSISNINQYWRDDNATKEAFVNGYFRTGDIGYLDADGFVFIVDRAKDIIIRGGENISCFEVESTLYKHAQVIEAAVFSVADERLGEAVGAVVYVADSGAVNEIQVKDFVGQHLAQFKVPQQIWLVEEKLPRLGSGKIDKRTLVSMFGQ